MHALHHQVRGAAGDPQVSGEEHRSERPGGGADVRASGPVRREGPLGGHGASRRLAHYAGAGSHAFFEGMKTASLVGSLDAVRA